MILLLLLRYTIDIMDIIINMSSLLWLQFDYNDNNMFSFTRKIQIQNTLC